MRDTDKDWIEIGRSEPFFGVLSNPQYLKEKLTHNAIDEFYKTGEGDIEYIVKTFEEHFGVFCPTSALDFGCGVGRLLLPIAQRVSSAVGIDVSSSMLEETMKRAELLKIQNIHLYEAIPEGQFDWINSLIVFQHIPPAKGYKLLEKLLGCLSQGGLCSIQLTFFRESNHLDEILRDVKTCSYNGESVKVMDVSPPIKGHISMYDYDLSQVLSIFVKKGLVNYYMEHTNHGGCHGAFIFSKKVA